MHRTPIKRIALAVLCALPIAAAADEGITLKPQRSLLSLPPAGEEPTPVFIEADKIEGTTEKEARAEGNVQLRRHGQLILADKLHYEAVKQELDASGNVRLEHNNDVLEGEQLRFNLATERGFMEKPTFRFTPVPRTDESDTSRPGKPRRGQPSIPAGPGPATVTVTSPVPTRPGNAPLDSRGSAERVIFEGPDFYRIQQASYTTCGPGNDDWFLLARELEIDKNRDIGVARGASVVFLDHTILYTPYISFSLQQQRKSGLLPPHYGTASTTGTEFTQPYYWNIAPHRDATFYPRLMSKRGLQLATDFRYLDDGYRGDARVEYLPQDRQIGEDRYGYFLKHSHSFPNGWSSALNINRVSDDRYFTDLSTLVAVTSRVTLPNEGMVARSGEWGDGTYTFSALAQQWQTLQTDPRAPLTPPYNRVPQLTLSGFRQDLLKSDVDLLASYVDFHHPSLVNGKRLLAYPAISVPVQNSYAYVTPRIGMHATRYIVAANTEGLDDRSRTLPIVSVDSGLVFERDTVLKGRSFTQTLEPKLFYVYIPYRDQSRFPNFESGQQDISFATMFTENQFSGHDRVNDANQVTAGVTSRFIDSDSGVERLRLALAQRFYFQDQRVTLPGIAPRPDHSASSDLLAALSGTVFPNWTAEVGLQYSSARSELQKSNVAARYQPAPGKVLNLAYRHTSDLIAQTDLSAQWPLTNNWTAMARWNYSTRDSRTLEALAGFEYDGGCWAFRAVGHRFVTALSTVSTSIFVQLELNGVSRIGSNPLDVLRRNVGGYTRLDPRAPRTDDYHVPDR
jgi:LPS-assembly protein